MPARNVVCSESDPNLIIPNLDWVIPEAAPPSRWAGYFVNVVHEDVDLAGFGRHFLKKCLDFSIIGMVDLGAYTNAAGFFNRGNAAL